MTKPKTKAIAKSRRPSRRTAQSPKIDPDKLTRLIAERHEEIYRDTASGNLLLPLDCVLRNIFGGFSNLVPYPGQRWHTARHQLAAEIESGKRFAVSRCRKVAKQTLKAGTRIEINGLPAPARATIDRWPTALGPIFKGWHIVKFADGGKLCVHESRFRVIDSRSRAA
jgi:hypothetical protein